MKLKTIIFICLLSLYSSVIFAQNPLTMGVVSDDTLIVNTGLNFLLLPNIDDGEVGEDQNITITATSSNTSIVEIDRVEFVAGNNFAVVYVDVKDVIGVVTISITAKDDDGQVDNNFDVYIEPYSKPGLVWSVFDIIFWQTENPIEKTPLFSTIINTSDFKSSTIDWSKVPLTVSAGCESGWCDGHDFSTTMISGYLIPPTTGEYKFYQKHENLDEFWLGTDGSFKSCVRLISDLDSLGFDEGGSEWSSSNVSLTAGKVYAFYSTHWNIHYEDVAIYWTVPGESKKLLNMQDVMYIYDNERPIFTSNISLIKKGVNDLEVVWSQASDNQSDLGYNIYVDGVKKNNAIINDTIYLVEALLANTKYSIVVTAVDAMGNESDISNTLNATTYPVDNTPPPAPVGLVVVDASGLAVSIAWNPVVDAETDVRGYDVYVDGVKYNSDNIYDTIITIFDLYPSTNYDITVVAIDAAYNNSVASTILNIRTTKYSVGNDFGVVSGRLSIDMDPISWNHGMGINPPAFHKENKAPDDLFYSLMNDLQPGNIRFMWDWGLAGTCDDYAAPGLITGPDLPYTIGDFMNLCNDYDAYAMLTISLQDDAAFINNPESFDNLLEYFCGPSTTTWGMKRASGGYTEPLIDNCKGLVIEFGNEVWGGDSHCIHLGEDYKEYAKWCREMDARIKASPYYDPNKIFTSYSGRNPNPSELNTALFDGDDKQVDWVALGGYLGGNFDYSPSIDPGDSELDYLKNGVKVILGNIKTINSTRKEMLSRTGEIKPIWFYEGNMTNSSYFGRFGQAIIYTDYAASVMEEGVITTLFSLNTGEWKMFNPLNNKKLPLFHTAAHFNHLCKGHVLKTNLESTSTIEDANGVVIDGDPVGSYAYCGTDNMTILLVNRNFEKDAYIQIDIPDTLTYSSNAIKYVFTSDHYSSYETVIDTVAITITDSMMVKVPRGGLVYVTLDGLKQNLEPLPLASFNEYVKTTSVEITSETGFDITEDGGKLTLVATVLPDDAYVGGVSWSVVENNIGAVFGTKLGNFIVRGGSDSDNNGEVKIKATANGYSDIFKIITVTISGQVAIEDNASLDFSIYPNPATDILNIEVSKDNAFVTISNIQGVVMVNDKLNNHKSQIDISNLNTGIYLITVKTNQGSKVIRFVKE